MDISPAAKALHLLGIQQVLSRPVTVLVRSDDEAETVLRDLRALAALATRRCARLVVPVEALFTPLQPLEGFAARCRTLGLGEDWPVVECCPGIGVRIGSGNMSATGPEGAGAQGGGEDEEVSAGGRFPLGGAVRPGPGRRGARGF